MNEEERYLFDLQGYLVVPDVLAGADVAELNRLVDSHPNDRSILSEKHWRAGGFLDWDAAFRQLLDHPRILPYLVEMVGTRFRLDHYYAIYMGEGGDGLPLHGGGTPYDPAQYYVVRDGRMYNGLTVVAWNLTETRPGDGGFCCVPGSHKSHWRLPEALRRCESVAEPLRQVPVPAGSVTFFTEALTHGTLPWRAAHERRALLFKYSPGHESWSSRYPNPDAEGYTERQRRILQPPGVYQRKDV